MKKLAILLIFLSLTRIGVAYAAESTVSNVRGSYFFGASSREGADVVNSVLALLIGPEGKPGLLGPAGKSAFDLAAAAGFTGTQSEWLVSLTGRNGDSAYDIAIQTGFKGTKEEWLRTLVGTPGGGGAAGAAGAAGTGVTVADEAAGANCANGGKKLTSTAGVSYVCNGTNGTGGSGSGGSIGYGAGEVSIGACTDTATVGVKAQFTGSDFVMENLTISGLQAGCAGKTFNFYYAIDSNVATVLKNPAGVYTHGNKIKCTLSYPTPTEATKVPAASSWGTPQLTITSSNSICNVVGNNTNFTIDKISTADYTNRLAFEILSS